MAAKDRPRALVVDDNPHTRKLIRSILTSVRLEVRECADGREALQLLDLFEPDIVLVDYEMPGMNGVEFTRALRRSSEPRVRLAGVVMVTGHADRRHVVEAGDAGVDSLITKPITLEALLGRTELVMQKVSERRSACTDASPLQI